MKNVKIGAGILVLMLSLAGCSKPAAPVEAEVAKTDAIPASAADAEPAVKQPVKRDASGRMQLEPLKKEDFHVGPQQASPSKSNGSK